MKRWISILLVAALFAVMTVSASAYHLWPDGKTAEQAVKDYENAKGVTVTTNRYYFQMPDGVHGPRDADGLTAGSWYNDYSDGAGVYWWGGTAACDSWAGYKATLADAAQHIYYVDIPDDVVMFIWNNGVDPGKDPAAPCFAKAAQSIDVPCEYAEPDEYESLPEGTDSFDNCIYIIRPDSTSLSEYNPLRPHGGDWYFYYGNGCYGSYAEDSAHFIDVNHNCLNPDHYQDGDVTGKHLGAETAGSDDDGLWVVADGKWYAVTKGQVFDYVFRVNTGEKICSLDAETFFDVDGLAVLSNIDYYDDDAMAALFPIIKDRISLNTGVPGRLKYNYSDAKGKKFAADSAELIRMRFKVAADKGVYHINTYLHTVAGADEHKYIYKDQLIDSAIRSSGVLQDENGQTLTASASHPTEPAPTEPKPTEPKPTEPEPTEPKPTEPKPTEPKPTSPVVPNQPDPTQPAISGLWVVADDKWYEVSKGQVFDYVFCVNTGEKICSLDAETFYDTQGLTLKSSSDDNDEDAMAALFPIIKDSIVLNSDQSGRLKYNYSSAKGKKFNSNDAVLIRARFEVTAEEGVYHINTKLHTLSGADEHKYIYDNKVTDDLLRAEGLLEGLIPQGTSAVLGDVDGDGQVTIVDATFIQRRLAGIKIPFVFVDAVADTDLDTQVTIVDATFIQRYLAGIRTNDKIGKRF